MKSKILTVAAYSPFLLTLSSYSFNANAIQMISETECEHLMGGSYCTTTYKINYRNSGNTGTFFYDSMYRENSIGTPTIRFGTNPFGIRDIELERVLGDVESTTPWSGEKVTDTINNLANIKIYVNYLASSFKLTDDMKISLEKISTSAGKLADRLSGAGQVTNHMINQEWGYAGSELAVFLAATAVTLGAGALLTTVGAVGITSATILTVGGVLANIYIFDEMETYLDGLMEPLNHEGLLNELGDIIGIRPFEIEEDMSFCEDLPEFKKIDAGCFLPPIVLDLDGLGMRFNSVHSTNALFDINGDGNRQPISWPKKGNAVLFADWNNDGIMSDAKEIAFSRFMKNRNASDMEGLKLFDVNQDDAIDTQDEIYSKLKIWEDKNGDGISTTNEIKTAIEMRLVINFNGKSDAPFSVKNPTLKPVDIIDGNKVDHKFSFKYVKKDGSTNEGIAYSVRLKHK